MSAYDTEQFNAALRSYEEGDMEEARRQTQELLAQTKDDANVWCLEAQIRLALDDWPAMEFALDQALMLEPEYSTAHLLQSHMFSANDQPVEACEAARRALDFASEEGQELDALTQLSESLFGLGQKMMADLDEDDDWDDEEPIMPPEVSEVFQEGMSSIKKAIDLNDQQPEAWELYANYLTLFQHNDQALYAWEKAWNLDSSNLDYLHGMARAFEDIEDFESAHEAFTELFDLEAAIYNGPDAPPLLFDPEEFAQTAEDVWAEVQHELIDEDFPLMFDFSIFVYPERELLESATPESLFDPRAGIHVELEVDPIAAFSKNAPPPVVRMQMFQRNIERDLLSDDAHELQLSLSEDLENFVQQIYEYMESDDDDEWDD
ncbi:MAG: hypothetical protein EP343_11630 [Deltaproteobacteria bacterium]|nr:MAG: hypothetical protein EP343_11630 [Deltaproteobacteria bacterium]